MFEMAGGIGFNIHGLTGMIAIILMFIHAVWATIVLIGKNERAITSFHHFSVFVWAIWLISYVNGFFISMRQFEG